MRRVFSAIFSFPLLLLLIVAKVEASAISSLDNTLSSELDSLVASLPSGAVSSILVSDAGSGQVLYERNSRQNMLPASVLKVLTAVAAYDALGGDFRYSTRMLSKRSIKKSSVINGGMLVSFSGDPSLKREHIEAMLTSIKKQGVREINGSIWLDGSIYSGYLSAEGVGWNDLNICFAAPSSAMILDRNCFYALLKPNKMAGRKAVVEYARPEWPMRVDNQVVTIKPDAGELCQPKSWVTPGKGYRIDGCVETGDPPLRLAFAVNKPELAIKKFVIASLKRLGITHRGNVVIGQPGQAFGHVLAEHYSKPLSELLTFALETSDNLYSDSILKTLGYRYSGETGSYETGVAALTEILRKQGIELASSHFEDGSGLSRYNLISSATITGVLLSAWQQWQDKPPWLENNHQRDRWFKTGTMKGVSSIAGYVFPEDQAPLVFVVMLNGLAPVMQSSEAEIGPFRRDVRAFQHAFIHALLMKGKRQEQDQR